MVEVLIDSLASLLDAPPPNPDATLLAGINASVTSLTINAPLPANVTTAQFRIRIDAEWMTVTAIGGTGNRTWTVVRGISGSTAATHALGAGVYLVVLSAGLAQYIADTTYLSATSRTANTVLAAPDGSAGAATFRLIARNDLPTRLNATAFGAALPTGPTLAVPVAPTASANYGLVSFGTGPFDGTTAGFFAGSASGTQLAINAASGYAGNFMDFQLAGAARFLIGSRGYFFSVTDSSSSLIRQENTATLVNHISLGRGNGSGLNANIGTLGGGANDSVAMMFQTGGGERARLYSNIGLAVYSANAGAFNPTSVLEVTGYDGNVWQPGTNVWSSLGAGVLPLAAAVVSNLNAGGYDTVFALRGATSTGALKVTFAVGTIGTSSWADGNVATQTSDVYFITRDNAGNLVERMRIQGDANGRIGVGTTAPGVAFDVQNGTSPQIRARGSANPLVSAECSTGTIVTKIQSLSGIGGYVGTESNHTLFLVVNNTQQVSVTSTVATFAPLIRAPDGSATTPAYSFSAVTGLGMLRCTSAFSGVDFAINNSSRVRLCDGNGPDYGILLGSASHFAWNSTSLSPTVNSSPDLYLWRDAANILAQRNGVNGQMYRTYNTYTDASNYERAQVGWLSNVFSILVGAGGTGASRSMTIGVDASSTGVLNLQTSGSNRWQVTATGHFVAVSNLNFWVGTAALATTATAGFLGVNSCAGAPTGVPASIPTGQIPMVVDSTNSKLYAYIGGAWKSVTLA